MGKTEREDDILWYYTINVVKTQFPICYDLIICVQLYKYKPSDRPYEHKKYLNFSYFKLDNCNFFVFNVMLFKCEYFTIYFHHCAVCLDAYSKFSFSCRLEHCFLRSNWNLICSRLIPYWFNLCTHHAHIECNLGCSLLCTCCSCVIEWQAVTKFSLKSFTSPCWYEGSVSWEISKQDLLHQWNMYSKAQLLQFSS